MKKWRVSGQAGTKEFNTLNEARAEKKIRKANHSEDCDIGIDRLETGYGKDSSDTEWIPYE